MFDAEALSTLRPADTGLVHRIRAGHFINWGACSVPVWAEPIGELGTIAFRSVTPADR